MMECSRTTGSHCEEQLIPSSEINSCSTPTAITGNYTDTLHVITAAVALLESTLSSFKGQTDCVTIHANPELNHNP